MKSKKRKAGRPFLDKKIIHKRKMFGKEIKKRLIDNDMTQTELAEYLGTSINNLNIIIQGNNPGTKYRKRIAEKLNIDLNKYFS